MARSAGTKAERAPAKSLEQRLWDAADALRGNQEPSEYKHVVLGLVFLKYISDRFEARRKEIEAALSDPSSTDYIPNEARRRSSSRTATSTRSHNVFWVPGRRALGGDPGAAPSCPRSAQVIDTAMDLIEKENPSIRGVLPRNYGREGLDKGRLGQLVDLIGSIGFTETDDHGSDDVLGRVYEYFLGQFAGKETGKDAGAFYTPRSVVKTLVEMLEPYQGRVYDPACGSGGMFVQSAEFVKAHGGKRTDISVYGQEFTDTTWKLAKMNLALRGIEADLGERSADSFTQDLHPDLRADFVLANPPFNVVELVGRQARTTTRAGSTARRPQGNANFAWVQHFIHHLSPEGHRRLRARQRLALVQERRRGRDPPQARRGRPRRLHRRDAGQAVLQHWHPGLPLVRLEGPARQRPPQARRRGAVHRRPQARGDGDPTAARAGRRGHRAGLPTPITRGARMNRDGPTRTSPGFCAASPTLRTSWRRATSSLRADTLGPAMTAEDPNAPEPIARACRLSSARRASCWRPRSSCSTKPRMRSTSWLCLEDR